MAFTWSEDVRWMVVWRREFRGQSYRHITKRLSAGPRRKGPSRKTIKRIVARFRREGDVKTRQGARKAPPANRIFDRRNDKALLRVLADSPGDMLDEIRDKLTARTGAQPHLSTVCRAIWRLRHSRKRVRQCATPRARTTAAHGRLPAPRSCVAISRGGARVRLCGSRRTYGCGTGSDSSSSSTRRRRTDGPCAGTHTQRLASATAQAPMRVTRACGGRSFGYMTFGQYPISPNAILPRGKRISSLCCMDYKGMVDWEHTDGTFDRRAFLRAVRRCVVSRHTLSTSGVALASTPWLCHATCRHVC